MNYKRFIAFMLVLLLAAPAPIFAYDGEARLMSDEYGQYRQFIVKYKDTSFEKPFDTVSYEELQRLKRADALLWYEPDYEIPLSDPVDPPEQGGGDAIIPDQDNEQTSPGAIDTTPDAIDTTGSAIDTTPAAIDTTPGAIDTTPEAITTTALTWHLEQTGAQASIEQGLSGAGIRIAIVDSGIASHPAIVDNIAPGKCYVPESAETDTNDKLGHGTKVASLIAGRYVEDDVMYYIGAAYGATLVPFKVTDTQKVPIDRVLSAIYDAVDVYDCDVINLSLMFEKESKAFTEAIGYAAEKGVVIAAAVGNNGGTDPTYPSVYETVIGATATNKNGGIYSNANRSAGVFIAAPGVNVRVASFTSNGTQVYYDYTESTGTSFASPQVCACAALLLAEDSRLTPGSIMACIEKGAVDKGAEGYDTGYGHGLLNIEDSLAAIAEVLPANTDPGTDPDPTTDPGQTPGTDPDPKTDPGQTPGTDPDPTTDPGQTPGTDPDPTTDPGQTPGTDPSPSTGGGGSGSSGSSGSSGNSGSSGSDGSSGGGGSSGGSSGGGSSGGGGGAAAPANTQQTAPAKTEDTPEIIIGELSGTNDRTAASLKDVEKNRWSANAINYVVLRGIFNGNGDGTFGPYELMTKAMTTQVLYNLAGKPSAENKLPFTDKDSLLWFTDSAAWAYALGLINGDPDGSFGGDKAITREEFVTVVYRFAKKAGLDTTARASLDNFRDQGSVRDFSKEAMQWAVAVGLITGDEGRLKPEDPADREQIAAIIMRLCELIEKQQSV